MASTGAQLQSAAAEERAVRELVAWLRARRLNLTEAGESVRWLSYLLDPAPPAAGASRSHSGNSSCSVVVVLQVPATTPTSGRRWTRHLWVSAQLGQIPSYNNSQLHVMTII